jgi:hypothetical protein
MGQRAGHLAAPREVVLSLCPLTIASTPFCDLNEFNFGNSGAGFLLGSNEVVTSGLAVIRPKPRILPRLARLVPR